MRLKIAILICCMFAFVSADWRVVSPEAAANTLTAEKLTQKERDHAVNHLAETREAFLRSIADLSEAQWNFKSAPERWSIAEVAEHIALSETLILQLVTERVMKSPPSKPAEGAHTDEAVVRLITDRTGKVQAPEILKPVGKWATREALIRDFDEARARTIAYVRETQDDLRAHSLEHPLLKSLDGYQWVLLLSAHSARHTAQIEEVKAAPNFPAK